MDCIFCKIAQGIIPCKKVFENEHVLAFHDIQPATEVHVLIIPKKHIASHNEWSQDDSSVLGELMLAAQEVAKITDVQKTGYRLINNCGPDAGQIVFHYHLHLLGGQSLGGLIAKEH